MQQTHPGHTAPAPWPRAVRTPVGGLATGAIGGLLLVVVLPWAFRTVGALLPGEAGGWGRWVVAGLGGLWLAWSVAGFGRAYARQLSRYTDLEGTPYAATIRHIAFRSVLFARLIEAALVVVGLGLLALALRAWGRW